MSANPSLASVPWVSPAGTLHETYHCLFVVKGKVLGEAAIDPGSAPGLRYRRTGAALFCPSCGDVWGRLVLIDSAGRQMLLEVETVSCEAHPDQWAVAGSFLNPPLEGLLPYLPPAVLRREFDLTMRKVK